MSKKGGHHGGSWKVAYADFVTAMMALFLCLWLTAQDTKIKDAVERAFRNPFSSLTKESTGIIPSDNKNSSDSNSQGKFSSVSAVEMETMKHISEDLAKILQQQDDDQTAVKIEMMPDGLKINVFDRSHKPVFEPNTDVFTSYGAWVFSTLAWEISRYTTFKIELEGHTAQGSEGLKNPGIETASTPAVTAPEPPSLSAVASEIHEHGTGPAVSGDWELSTERANAARRKLVQSGVTLRQIAKVSGFADTMPMPDLPPAAEANRRVTVLLKLKESVAGLTGIDRP